MARETERIADQLRRAWQGPAWHGPSLLETLEGITEEQATSRPIAPAHTIQELVLHIAAWMRIARERISATAIREETAEENWTPTPGPWKESLAALEREQKALQEAVLNFPEDGLDEPAPATEPQSFYVLFQGVVQHNLYHCGQIAILKKMAGRH